MNHPTDKPIRTFDSQDMFRQWLAAHHADTDGIWLRMYKKASGKQTVNYDQALDVALCYGWIDGQVRSYDAESYIQRFTPRRKRSSWSKQNIANVTRLIKEGKMRPSGLKEIDAAKADGRWDAAYDSPSTMVIPEDFLDELKKDPKAKAFFDSLSKANLYAIGYRLQTAKKPETRARWIRRILASLAEGKAFH